MPAVKGSLKTTFNKISAEAYKAFPDELERLAVIMVNDATPAYLAPAVAAELATRSPTTISGSIRKFSRLLPEGMAAFALKDHALAGVPADIILLKGNRGDAEKMDVIWTLDHEIGHHILRNGYSGLPDNTSESAADAYAALRHIQRFGRNSGYIQNEIRARATGLIVDSDMDHYTSDALERAVQVADRMGSDFFKLSLHETAALAAKIAGQKARDAATLKRICHAWQPMRDIYDPAGLKADDMRKAFLTVMKRYPHDRNIRKAGERFLEYHLPDWKKQLNIRYHLSLRERKGPIALAMGR